MSILIPRLIIPIYAITMMWILLGVQTRRVFSREYPWIVPYILGVIALNVTVVVVFGDAGFGKSAFFIMHLPTILFFSFVSKYKGIKLIFVFLTAFIFSALPNFATKVIFAYIPSGGLFLRAVLFLLICLSILAIMYFCFRPSFLYMLEHGNTKDFSSFLLMPLLCGIYFYLANQKTFSVPTTQPQLVQFMPTLICVVSYFLLVTIFKRTRDMQVLQHEKSILAMQAESAKQQFMQLKAMQDQTAIYRHDMRHHITLLSNFAAEGELDKIQEYLAVTQANIEDVTPKRYCCNDTANLILTYFYYKAKKVGVELVIVAVLPENLSTPETELCTILSNGLENAIHAATLVEDNGDRVVQISIQIHRNNLLISIENNFVGEVVLEEGLPKCNQEGHGFGTKSMAVLVEKRKGYCLFDVHEHVFTLKIALPLPQ